MSDHRCPVSRLTHLGKIPVIVGEQGKKCRLVAMRAAPEIIAACRAERRRKARESGKQLCPKDLHCDGWHLMLTNVSKERADVSQLAAIYRARWAVESKRPKIHPLSNF